MGAMEGARRGRGQGYVAALVNMGSALRQLGRLKEAEKAYRDAVARENGGGGGRGGILRCGWGWEWCCGRRRRWRRRWGRLGERRGLRRGRSEPHLETGEILAELGRHAEAVVELELAIGARGWVGRGVRRLMWLWARRCIGWIVGRNR